MSPPVRAKPPDVDATGGFAVITFAGGPGGLETCDVDDEHPV
jgi:hypothetical protein